MENRKGQNARAQRRREILDEIQEAMALLAAYRRERDRNPNQSLDQEWLGQQIRVTQEHISKLERGHVDIRVSTLAEYVEALGGELRILARFRDAHGEREAEVMVLPRAQRRRA